jgi:hypothetical protein
MTSGHLNARLATIHQTVILVDPMKSAKTNGWAHGQLQAPT